MLPASVTSLLPTKGQRKYPTTLQMILVFEHTIKYLSKVGVHIVYIMIFNQSNMTQLFQSPFVGRY